jgi:hypothetical protein
VTVKGTVLGNVESGGGDPAAAVTGSGNTSGTGTGTDFCGSTAFLTGTGRVLGGDFATADAAALAADFVGAGRAGAGFAAVFVTGLATALTAGFAVTGLDFTAGAGFLLLAAFLAAAWEGIVFLAISRNFF